MNLFKLEIIKWYEVNSRDLPWRSTKNPFVIWMSEIILQQTRVQQGLPYFYKFTERFKTVCEFANAEENEILTLWQGLGYYSRARNMLKCAQIICNEHDGSFPNTYEGLLKLPGIGPYTAAAIASFSFNENVAVVDGNVQRLISRYIGVVLPVNEPKGMAQISAYVNEEIKEVDPSAFNQAMMELGSLVCKPKNPNCAECPLVKNCFAYANDQILNLPLKTKKVKVSKKFYNYFICEKHEKVMMIKREGKGTWQNLFEFPMIESEAEYIVEEALFLGSFKHVLSHQKIEAKLWKVKELPVQLLNNKCIFEASIDEIGKQYPIHQLMKKMNKVWQG